MSVAEKLSAVTEIKLSTLDNAEEFVLSVDSDFVNTTEEDTILKQKISEAEQIKIISGSDTYVYFSEENIVEKNGVSLGKGAINVKVSKPKKAEDNQFKVEVYLSPLKEKDSEITPFDSVEQKNEKIINQFLAKWVKEPHKILEKKEGCEIN